MVSPSSASVWIQLNSASSTWVLGTGSAARRSAPAVPGRWSPGGLYGFAVMPALLPDSDDEVGQATGYPDYLAELLAQSEVLTRETYVHRRQADGSPHQAVALVGRM